MPAEDKYHQKWNQTKIHLSADIGGHCSEFRVVYSHVSTGHCRKVQDPPEILSRCIYGKLLDAHTQRDTVLHGPDSKGPPEWGCLWAEEGAAAGEGGGCCHTDPAAGETEQTHSSAGSLQHHRAMRAKIHTGFQNWLKGGLQRRSQHQLWMFSFHLAASPALPWAHGAPGAWDRAAGDWHRDTAPAHFTPCLGWFLKCKM